MHRAAPSIILAICLALAPAAASARTSYVNLPAEEGKKTSLQVRFVDYTGGTNGEMVMDVKNRGQKSERFNPKGMFFVPNGDPESAPQRLGAAGPFKAHVNQTWRRYKKGMMLAPGAMVRVKLQVFCIDSHRSSPGSKQGFKVARERLPAELQQKIHSGAQGILSKNKGNMRRSKSAIQSHIWQTRDKKWIKLEGERKGEEAQKNQRQNRTRNTLEQPTLQRMEPQQLQMQQAR